MALRLFNVREALQEALLRLGPLKVNVRLVANEQALAGELEQACTLALNALRADDTVAQGQRTARASQMDDKVKALGTTEQAKGRTIGVDAFYNALDLVTDAADAIREGRTTFLSDISTVAGARG